LSLSGPGDGVFIFCPNDISLIKVYAGILMLSMN
jgi:hypothetical protein